MWEDLDLYRAILDSLPKGWSQCYDCKYEGPTTKEWFRSLPEDIRLCPGCRARIFSSKAFEGGKQLSFPWA